MRDPDGSIEFRKETVIRHLRSAPGAEPFLRGKVAGSLVASGALVPFTWLDGQTLESQRIPFVSLPYEWCDAQLRAAAELTLLISRAIIADGFELKDASAWNIIFEGARPTFCDHLSFQPIAGSKWWAFGQFVRHFTFPLAVSQLRGLKSYQAFILHRDGLPPEEVRRIIGLRRFLTRYWPLLIDSCGSSDTLVTPDEFKPGKTLHENLYRFCEWSLGHAGKSKIAQSKWSNYTNTREHYNESALSEKFTTVESWLARIKPKWVVDFGCNTGEFSRLSAARGAKVVAIDLDHDCIQQLFLENTARTDVYPVVANLGDMLGGTGWIGEEFPSLAKRLMQHADMVLMLALVHHLAISEGIPLLLIAELAYRVSREHAIIEIIDADDALVQRLASHRNRAPHEFSLTAQKEAFGRFFVIKECAPLTSTRRQLLLLEKRR